MSVCSSGKALYVPSKSSNPAIRWIKGGPSYLLVPYGTDVTLLLEHFPMARIEFTEYLPRISMEVGKTVQTKKNWFRTLLGYLGVGK